MTMKRRVVITGLGALSPVGNNVNDTFNNLINGKNGIDFIKQFDPSNLRIKIAGELKDLNLEDYFDKKEIKRSDRVMLLGTIAALEAFNDANLENASYDPYRFGIFVTSGVGGLTTLQDEISVRALRGANRISPFFIPNSIINM